MGGFNFDLSALLPLLGAGAQGATSGMQMASEMDRIQNMMKMQQAQEQRQSQNQQWDQGLDVAKQEHTKLLQEKKFAAWMANQDADNARGDAHLDLARERAELGKQAFAFRQTYSKTVREGTLSQREFQMAKEKVASFDRAANDFMSSAASRELARELATDAYNKLAEMEKFVMGMDDRGALTPRVPSAMTTGTNGGVTVGSALTPAEKAAKWLRDNPIPR